MAALNDHGLPSFEEVQAALYSEAPRRWGLQSKRRLSLVAEPADGSIWLLCPMAEREAQLVNGSGVIKADVMKVGLESHLRIGSDSQPLLREIFFFLSSIVDRAEQSNEALSQVIEVQIAAWKMLLRASPPMDRATQIGLLGELWVLWRLVGNLGPSATKTWMGPRTEQHDFRLPFNDVEVKTTLSHARDHTISGLDQLSTTSTRCLSVISVQLKPSGGGPGFSLNQAVERLSLKLGGDIRALEEFNQGLAKLGYRASDAEHYEDRFCLRTDPKVIPVDHDFPLLATERVAKCMTAGAFQRLRKVLYTVNLDGLGRDIDQAAITPLLCPEQGDIDA